jgi:hypothetical protein
MNKQILALAICVAGVGISSQSMAQANKNKKTKYYQNNPVEAEFDVKGFHVEPPKNEVDRKPVEEEYDVKVERNEEEGKYRREKKVKREAEAKQEEEATEEPKEKVKKNRYVDSYPTTYGSRRNYNEGRNTYDKYYTGSAPTPPPPPPLLNREEEVKPTKVVKKVVRVEKEVKMTPNEREYQTTVVKKRYTNLDVLCDDLDLAKIQRPVLKGICSECSRDVDAIIINRNLSSLEKNYNLKQCYMLRDKRLRETLEDDQYKKWLRIKDSDEYLIITKDLELKDGVNN